MWIACGEAFFWLSLIWYRVRVVCSVDCSLLLSNDRNAILPLPGYSPRHHIKGWGQGGDFSKVFKKAW